MALVKYNPLYIAKEMKEITFFLLFAEINGSDEIFSTWWK